MKAVVAAFNQEKALVGAFSEITNLRMELFEALCGTLWYTCRMREEVLPHCRLCAGAVGCQGEAAQEPVAGVQTVPAPGPGPPHR